MTGLRRNEMAKILLCGLILTLLSPIIYVFKEFYYFCTRFNFVIVTILYMEKVQEYLLSKGIRPSPQRVAIMGYLFENCTHPTVDAVYGALHVAMPTLSKTTVYNTLKLFEEKQALQILNIDEKNVRLDACMEPHAHFQCVRCGQIFDVPFENKDAVIGILKTNHLEGFKIQQEQIYYKGICPRCQNENE